MMKRTLVMTIMMLAGCGSTNEEPAPSTTEAKESFWDAVGSGDIDAVPPARDRMLAAFEKEREPDTARLIGMSYLLSMAEQDKTRPPDLAAIDDAMTKGGDYLDLATQLSAPDQARASWNSGFFGALLVSRGSFRSDEATIQRGRDMLASVAREIPSFGLLATADVMRDTAAGSNDFTRAVESYFQYYERCTGTTIDREHPDLAVVLKRPFADPHPSCGNEPHVPHNVQGGLFCFADSLVKANKVDAARPIYDLIEKTEGFDSWKYASLVDDRLSSDLAARAAAYQSGGNPRRQPAVGTDCFGCHQR